MTVLEWFTGFFARKRDAGERRARAVELKARAAFCGEFDRRRAAWEANPNLSRFEREWVEDTAPKLAEIRAYMARHRTWMPPSSAFK